MAMLPLIHKPLLFQSDEAQYACKVSYRNLGSFQGGDITSASSTLKVYGELTE